MSAPTAHRTLVLVRHAKAEPSGPSDHARVLADRGHATSAAVGTWLADQQISPDVVLVSDATRTLQTWEGIAQAADWSIEATMVAALYSAGTENALDLIREGHADATTVVVVGHNPTIASLVELLGDGEGDHGANIDLLMSGYPPGSVTILSVPGEWARLGEGGASVVAFRDGRE